LIFVIGSGLGIFGELMGAIVLGQWGINYEVQIGKGFGYWE
jgi:hypothetical protein